MTLSYGALVQVIQGPRPFSAPPTRQTGTWSARQPGIVMHGAVRKNQKKGGESHWPSPPFAACRPPKWARQHPDIHRDVGWMMGFEPTTTGVTIRGSTTELHPPLHEHLHIVWSQSSGSLKSIPTSTSMTNVISMARPAGLEPATYGLEGRCSIRLSYRRRN